MNGSSEGGFFSLPREGIDNDNEHHGAEWWAGSFWADSSFSLHHDPGNLTAQNREGMENYQGPRIRNGKFMCATYPSDPTSGAEEALLEAF